ncbi:MAG: mechanosensitive ion channel [Candidatus Brocadiaceae bacterium]|nr:mechanosensitive ion channel [Candidatus Brocadiaceae bacterium]
MNIFYTIRSLKRYCACLFVMMLFICFVSDLLLFGQENPSVPKENATARPLTPQQEITAKRDKLAKELGDIQSSLEVMSGERNEEQTGRLTKEKELLQRLDLLYMQQLSMLGQESALKVELEQLERELEMFRTRGTAELQTYSFMLLENLRDELHSLTSREQARESSILAAQDALQEALSAYEEKERVRRQAKEAMETNKDSNATFALSNALRIARRDSLFAQEQTRLREIELSNQKLEKNIHQVQLLLLQEKTNQISRTVIFRKQDLIEILAELDEREFKLNQEMERAKLDLSLLDIRWADARRRLDESVTSEQELQLEVDARQLVRQVKQREVTLLGNQLQHLAEARTTWNRRFELFNATVKTGILKDWELETKKVITQLLRENRMQSTRLSELRREISSLRKKIEEFPKNNQKAIRWLYEQKRYLEQLIHVYETSNTRLEWARSLHEKLLLEINAQIETVTWEEWISVFWETVKKIWRYELTTVDDRPITVSKIIIALLFVLFGFFVSRYISHLLGLQLLPRLHVPESVTAACEAMVFYLFLLIFTVLALRIVNLPLTVFAMLGGALAIGVGFGSQNIINNFISGLILFAEHPIKIGDLVDIDGIYGTVEHIGARSTRIRSSQNTHIIVPNSSFLQKNVLNWTHSDRIVRTSVKVGVTYGSPTREVERLLRKAVEEHGRVLKKYEIILLFTNFGNNALEFEVFFWVQVKTMMDRWTLESDIRFHVDSLFREAGIVIAFPQRDVHLYNPKPLEVRIVEEKAGREGTPGS